MADIVAVLVVPTPEDPGGLLRTGRCGIIPAIAELRLDYDPVGARTGGLRWVLTSNRWSESAAVPLWWDGALVEEGWDRANRVLDAHDPQPDQAITLHPDLDQVLLLATALAFAGLAAPRVVRLARVDGRLVEVP